MSLSVFVPIPPTAPEPPLLFSSRIVCLLYLTSLSIVEPGFHIWRLKVSLQLHPADPIRQH